MDHILPRTWDTHSAHTNVHAAFSERREFLDLMPICWQPTRLFATIQVDIEQQLVVHIAHDTILPLLAVNEIDVEDDTRKVARFEARPWFCQTEVERVLVHMPVRIAEDRRHTPQRYDQTTQWKLAP